DVAQSLLGLIDLPLVPGLSGYGFAVGATALRLGHPFPETYSAGWIAPRLSHQDKTSAIAIRLLGAAARKHDGSRFRNAGELGNILGECGVCYADAGGKDLSDYFCAYGLAYALGAMARECVRNFMSHNHRDAVVVLGDGHNTLPEGYLPAGQAKGVYLFTLEHLKFPLIVWSRRCGSDSLPHTLQLCLPIRSL